MSEWRPIESAPKDSTEILLHYKYYLGERDFIASGHWFNGKSEEDSTWEHSYGFGDANHWMPLPPPPSPPEIK